MKYKGINPVVKLVKGTYKNGVKLTKNTMDKIENMINRLPDISKWAVDIPLY